MTSIAAIIAATVALANLVVTTIVLLRQRSRERAERWDKQVETVLSFAAAFDTLSVGFKSQADAAMHSAEAAYEWRSANPEYLTLATMNTLSTTLRRIRLVVRDAGLRSRADAIETALDGPLDQALIPVSKAMSMGEPADTADVDAVKRELNTVNAMVKDLLRHAESRLARPYR